MVVNVGTGNSSLTTNEIDQEDPAADGGGVEDSAESAFGLSDVEFEALMSQVLQKDPISVKYPEIFHLAPSCLVKWRQRYRGNRSVWKRLFNQERVLKEFIEAAPIIDAVRIFVDHTTTPISETDKFTVIDLASGKGFLSMFLSEMLPPSKIKRFVLMDKAWPMHGAEPQAHHMSWEHIYGELPPSSLDPSGTTTTGNDEGKPPLLYVDTWPIPLATSKQDLKHGNQRRNLEEKFLSNEPVILLAVHLCGTLSLKAVNFFNDHPNVIRFFALKPCCLPGMIHAKRHEVFSFGDHHSFDSKLVCVHGKWNKDKWRGPLRAKLEAYFEVWARNLFLGVNDATARKALVHVQVQHGGGFQNSFIFAERLPETSLVWEKLNRDGVETDKHPAVQPTCLPAQGVPSTTTVVES